MLPTSSPAPADLLPALLDLSPAGAVCCAPVLDAAGQLVDFAFVYLNAAAQRLLGLPAQYRGTLGQQFPQLLTSGEFAFLCAAFRQDEPTEHIGRYPFGRHDVRLRVTARRFHDHLLLSFAEAEAGKAGVQAGVAQAWAAYGEAVRQQEQLYHVLEQAPAMICVFDGPQHVFQFVNPPYQALVGPRPLLGRPIAEAMPELRGQPIFELLDGVYRTGETFYATEMLVQLDHENDGRSELEKRYYNFIYQARRNGTGAVDGIFVFAYEVTPLVQARQLMERQNEVLERRVAERTQALAAAQISAEQQRAQLDQLFMQAPAAICVLDGPELVYQLVNPTYQQAFPGRPLLGLPLLAALPELHDSPVPEILAGVYSTGLSFQAHELPLRVARTADGPLEDTFWTFTYQARRDPWQRIDGILVFAYDVTEQVRARQSIEASQRQAQALADELRQANLRLISANADLDNFIYTASHDLKAPITNIEGLLQALRLELQQPAAEADVETVLHLMQDSIRRFQRTIKYLTDVSRLQHPAPQLIAPIALTELVEGVRLDLAPLLAVSGGDVTVEPGSCAFIAFAEKDLRSIVYNLVSNALKYRHPERVPRVRVRCHLVAGSAVLEVQDNGLGLQLDQQQKIFGMFQRLHDHVDGSGIGLYLVKKVVDNAGGRIEVHSQPGEGSTFRVVLPQPLAAGFSS